MTPHICMQTIFHLVHEHLRRLEAYTPGVQPTGSGWIKLNTNELPFPPPACVREAIIGEVEGLARYPNPRSESLRTALADFHKLNVNQVIVGNGSDDILNLLVRAFGGTKRKTVDTFPSYSLYPVLTAIAGGAIESVSLGSAFQLPVDEILSTNPDLVFVTCPNAPTGVQFPLEDLEAMATSMKGLLVIDEAYVEFAEHSALPLLASHENVVITRTFSKAYGLAGLRVGYGLAAPAVICVLDRIRDSYNVNRLSQAGARAALQAQSVYQGFIKEVRETRDHVRSVLLELDWEVLPSATNFLFAAPVKRDGASGSEVASELFKHLETKRILLRYFPKHPLTARFLRISIGTKPEMERFLEEVKVWQAGE